MGYHQPGSNEDLAALARRVETDPGDLVALEELARRLLQWPPGAESCLAHSSPRVRLLALAACARGGAPEERVLSAAASDPSPALRCEAARLSRLATSSRSRDRLRGLLRDPDPSVRASAAAGLAATLADSELVALLSETASAEPEVKQQLLAALSERAAGAPADLVAAASRPADSARLPALEALGAFLYGHPDDLAALQALLAALEDADPRARRWAARALGVGACAPRSLGLSTDAVARLLRALAVAPSFEEQAAVLGALARSGDPTIMHEITALLGSRGARFDEIALDTVALLERLKSLPS